MHMCTVMYGRDGKERLTKWEKDFTVKKITPMSTNLTI